MAETTTLADKTALPLSNATHVVVMNNGSVEKVEKVGFCKDLATNYNAHGIAKRGFSYTATTMGEFIVQLRQFIYDRIKDNAGGSCGLISIGFSFPNNSISHIGESDYVIPTTQRWQQSITVIGANAWSFDDMYVRFLWTPCAGYDLYVGQLTTSSLHLEKVSTTSL